MIRGLYLDSFLRQKTLLIGKSAPSVRIHSNFPKYIFPVSLRDRSTKHLVS